MNDDEIKQAVIAYHTTMEELKTRHALEIQMVNDHLKMIRDNCQHNKITYYPDVSGNNDSEYICDICGRHVSRATYFKRTT